MFHFLHSRKSTVQVCMTNSFARSTRSLMTLFIASVFVLLGCHVKSREKKKKKKAKGIVDDEQRRERERGKNIDILVSDGERGRRKERRANIFHHQKSNTHVWRIPRTAVCSSSIHPKYSSKEKENFFFVLSFHCH